MYHANAIGTVIQVYRALDCNPNDRNTERRANLIFGLRFGIFYSDIFGTKVQGGSLDRRAMISLLHELDHEIRAPLRIEIGLNSIALTDAVIALRIESVIKQTRPEIVGNLNAEELSD